MDTVNILVTGIGAPGTLGTLESLKPAPFQYRLIGIDIDSAIANRILFDAFYTVPVPEDDEFINQLLKIVAREQVSIILPQVTRELRPLAAHKVAFARLGCRVLVNDTTRIDILNDKHRLMREMSRMGMPVPEHTLVHTKRDLELAAYHLGYPETKVVVKPPISNGMRGLRILSEPDDPVADFMTKKPDSAHCTLGDLLAIFPTPKIPDLLVCQYLPGTEVSVDCLCRHGDPVLVLPRTRDKIRSGITFAGTSVWEQVVIEQCSAIIRELELDHIVGFQFKYDEHGHPMILECNPRIQGTMVLGAFCCANVIVGAVCQALEMPFQFTQVDIEWGVKLSRYWGGIIYKDDRLIGKF
ncbi:MAG: ATP-dependent carboxylate-amine ligase [Chloroflexi bacterium]|nr:MAG: ATP-dependent carboxylate-amine ligase [Chloroflexota bacterium]RLC86617.1 MAG: ATP-dependent carboxylate-amine ligase [Chloroflexota bacterium]